MLRQLAISEWRRVKTWITLSMFFTFFWNDTSKNAKSRVFWILKKKVKNIFSNYGSERFTFVVARDFMDNRIPTNIQFGGLFHIKV